MSHLDSTRVSSRPVKDAQQAIHRNVNPLRTMIDLVLQLMKRPFQNKYLQECTQIVTGGQKPRVRYSVAISFQE